MTLGKFRERSSARDALLVSLSVAASLGLFGLVFGSADVEESANSSYSAGANHATAAGTSRDAGTHTLLGVPVFDTLQGTGDRLPYQASWGQSITWPLRFLVDWQAYHVWRSLFFAIPSIWICLRTLQSWRPSVSRPSMFLFGALTSSSFGLYLRQNEWSDHYVQTVGVCAVAMFFMHRWFHDQLGTETQKPDGASNLCLAISLNGVVTGHPGFWPIALAVWLSLGTTFATNKTLIVRLRQWLKSYRLSVGVVLVSTTLSFAAVFADLLSELKGLPFTVGRLGRSQGLFSEFAFGGLYGLSSGGSLPSALKSVLAAVLATTSMPFFILFDRLLPQVLRASDFPEMVRVEFSGALILVVVAISWRSIKQQALRSMVARIVAAEAIAWIYVAASAADLLPSPLTASGAWMALAVLLVFNVFLAWLLLGNGSRQVLLPKVITYASLALVGVWCFFQFGFLSFGSGFQVAKRHPSWLRNADQIVQDGSFANQRDTFSRILIIKTPRIYDSLPFIAVGQPVLAPADPKMRASPQLQGSFGLNYSINAPPFGDFDGSEIDRVLNFLQIQRVLVANAAGSSTNDVIERLGTTLDRQNRVTLAQATYDIYRRHKFSALIIRQSTLGNPQPCPVLQEKCDLLTSGTMTEPSKTSRLAICEHRCLWRFDSPAISGDDALVLPITYDAGLRVNDALGNRYGTANADGFLAIFSSKNAPKTTIEITLDPDLRMNARVVASYLNLLMVLLLVAAILSSRIRSAKA